LFSLLLGLLFLIHQPQRELLLTAGTFDLPPGRFFGNSKTSPAVRTFCATHRLTFRTSFLF